MIGGGWSRVDTKEVLVEVLNRWSHSSDLRLVNRLLLKIHASVYGHNDTSVHLEILSHRSFFVWMVVLVRLQGVQSRG